MLSLTKQLEQKRLVCPKTHECLVENNGYLVTHNGLQRYPLSNGVPIFIDSDKQQQYLTEDKGTMMALYSGKSAKSSKIDYLRYRLDKFAARNGDYRSQAAAEAHRQLANSLTDSDLFLSIGGGPMRAHPKHTNLNIGLFPNVDLVADAYELPYGTDCVDAIHCEAVLEHLEFPRTAVSEMFRVLKQGGKAFVATPFLQAFHGFPNHFQNFTLIGQERLFIHAGFEIISSGVCVGPTYTIVDMLSRYFTYLPTRILSQLFPHIIRAVGSLFYGLDKHLNNYHAEAHVMGSTTYVLAQKPFSNGS